MNSRAAWDTVLETLAQKQTNKKTVGGNQLETEISATTPLQYVAIGAAMASLPLIHGGAQGLPGGRVNAA